MCVHIFRHITLDFSRYGYFHFYLNLHVFNMKLAAVHQIVNRSHQQLHNAHAYTNCTVNFSQCFAFCLLKQKTNPNIHLAAFRRSTHSWHVCACFYSDSESIYSASYKTEHSLDHRTLELTDVF